MADMFKSCGYRTCAIGKWHLGLGETQGTQDWNAQIPMNLGDIGFDHHYIMAATADRVPCVFINDGTASWKPLMTGFLFSSAKMPMPNGHALASG